MRVFVALDFIDKDKDFFYSSFFKYHNLKSIRWVKKENIHLTLRFFPDINGTNLIQVMGILDILSKSFNIIAYSLSNKIGFFPDIKKPRVIYIGINNGKRDIINLYNKFMYFLKEYNISNFDNKPFLPHITIARVKFKQNLKNLYNNIKLNYSGKIKSLTFYQSILTPTGPIYKVLKSYSLKH